MEVQKLTNKINFNDVGTANIMIGSDSKFVPNLNASFKCESTQEHFFLNINRKDLLVVNEKPTIEQDKVNLILGNEKHIWHQEGTDFKWDIEFAVKPPSNILEWELQYSEGIEFLYQDTLENEFLYKDNDGFDNLEDFLKTHGRPDKVVGSYAVYCNRAGKYANVNFASGKLCHIYRPLVIDTDGKKEWAELHIDGNILRIILPQKFLDTAKYPITLDPDIGYTTEGGSNYTTGNRWRVHKHADYTTAGATGGTATSFYTSFSTWNTTDGYTIGVGYYSNGGGADARDDYATDAIPKDLGQAWRETSLNGGAIAANGRYYPALSWTDLDGGRIYYDTGNAGDGEWQDNSGTLALPSPHGAGWTASTYLMSMYFAYEESAGGNAPTGVFYGPLVGPMGGPI